MAAGEKRMLLGPGSGTRPTSGFEPFPAGEKELVLDEHSVTVKQPTKPGKTPYVKVLFTALGTAQQEGGKDRKVSHMFHLKLGPNAMYSRPGQLSDFAWATGNDIEPETAVWTDQDGAEIPYLDAEQVAEFVRQFGGNTFRAHISIDKGDAEYGPKNVISRFLYEADDVNEEAEEEVEPAKVTQLKKPAAKPVMKKTGTSNGKKR